MSRPFFTIGVTTFDRVELLHECLSSILAQSFVDFEVLVGNDNPARTVSRESTGIADERVRFVNRPRNLGEIANMNALLSDSSGSYFTWLADDDLLLPEALSVVRGLIDEAGAPPCIFGSYDQGEAPSRLTEGGQEGQPPAGSLSGEEFLSVYLHDRLRLQGCYGFFKSDTLADLGGMQPLGSGFSPYSDVLLAIRSARLSRLYYLPIPLVFYRTHLGSISLTSPDLRAFSSAQKDFIRESDVVLRSAALRHRRGEFLYLLLDRVRRDYFEVLRRGGRVGLAELFGFFALVAPHAGACREHWRPLARDSLQSIVGVLGLQRTGPLDALFQIGRFFRRWKKREGAKDAQSSRDSHRLRRK